VRRIPFGDTTPPKLENARMGDKSAIEWTDATWNPLSEEPAAWHLARGAVHEGRARWGPNASEGRPMTDPLGLRDGRGVSA
jgi:hypothetical protein